MTHVHGGLLVCAVAACLGLVLGNLAVAMARPWLRRATSSVEPKLLLRALIGLTLTPLLLAGALVLMALAPSLLGAIGWHPDHCAEAPGALHLCVVHGVLFPLSPLEQALVLIVVVAVALGLGSAWARVLSGKRALQALARYAVQEAGVWRIASDEPMAFSAGMFSPSVYLSSGLERRVSVDDIDVILAHERQHAAAHDALVRWLLRLLAAPLWGPSRRDVLSGVAFAQERLADEQAALVVGDRLRVAETLLRVCRLLRAAPVAGTCALASTHLEIRVDALCKEKRTSRFPRALLALLFALPLLLAGLGAPLHVAVERAAGAIVSFSRVSADHGPVHHTHE